jgi:hypothetical protein
VSEVEAAAVGGSHDKRLIKASVGHSPWIKVRSNPKRGPWIAPGEDVPPILIEGYRLETLHYMREKETSPDIYRFWVHESLTIDQACAMIMEGYAR